MMFSSQHLRSSALACALTFMLCPAAWAAQGKQVEVATIPALVEALQDPTVTKVIMTTTGLNLTETEMPFNAIVIADRNVTLEGVTQPDGSLLRVDANALGSRVLVSNSSILTMRNFWVDDCVLEGFPYTCFTVPGSGGARTVFSDGAFSDATCATLAESPGITTMLANVKVAQGAVYKEQDISDREILIIDTGWVPYAVDGAEWRFTNLTVSCTAGVTHPDVEEDKEDGPAPPASAARGTGTTAWAVAGLAAIAATLF